MAYAISTAWAKTEVLIELSLQFHKARYPSSAEKLLGEAKKNIYMIQEYPMKAKVLQQLGTMFSMIGEEKRAEEIWNETEATICMISEGQMQDEALGIFTNTLAQVQQWERAKEIAYRIGMSEYKANVLIELGIFLAQVKLWKRAKALWKEAKKQAHAIQDYSQSVITLIKLGTALAQTGHLEQAKSISKELITLVQNKVEFKDKIDILSYLFEFLIMIDSHKQILYIVQNIFLQVDTSEDAIKLLLLAFKLIHFRPEIGVSFYKSFKWVDNLSKG